MANKAAKPGTEEIRNARKLFEACKKSDDARFRYAALVIGENPLIPPKWAIEACIEERRRTERIAASRTPEPDGKILDEMAVIVVEHDLAQAKSKSKLRSPSLRSVIRKAVERVGWSDVKRSDDELRTLRRAWEKEQKRASQDAELIAGQKITPRIDRIRTLLFGQEYGTSVDVAVDTYWRYRKEIMRDPSMANIDIY